MCNTFKIAFSLSADCKGMNTGQTRGIYVVRSVIHIYIFLNQIINCDVRAYVRVLFCAPAVRF